MNLFWFFFNFSFLIEFNFEWKIYITNVIDVQWIVWMYKKLMFIIYLLMMIMMRKFNIYITSFDAAAVHQAADLDRVSLGILVKFFVIQIQLFSLRAVNVVKPVTYSNSLWKMND